MRVKLFGIVSAMCLLALAAVPAGAFVVETQGGGDEPGEAGAPRGWPGGDMFPNHDDDYIIIDLTHNDYAAGSAFPNGYYMKYAGFNSDGTRISCAASDDSDDKDELWVMDYDATTQTISNAQQITDSSGDAEIAYIAMPFWSRTDPDVVFYAEIHMTTANLIMKHDLSTGVTTTVYDPALDTNGFDLTNPGLLGTGDDVFVFGTGYNTGNDRINVFDGTYPSTTISLPDKNLDPASNYAGDLVTYYSTQSDFAYPAGSIYSAYEEGSWVVHTEGFGDPSTGNVPGLWAYFSGKADDQILSLRSDLGWSANGLGLYASDGTLLSDLLGTADGDFAYVYANHNWKGPEGEILFRATEVGHPGYGNNMYIALERPDEVYVDDDWTGPGNCGGHAWGYNAFASIQEAIDAVAGSTIYLGPGTYTEQLHITTDDLAIIGSGEASTFIVSPTALTDYFTTGSNDNYPVVFVDGATGFSLSDVTVDGDNQGDANYRFIGIGFWNGDGALTDVSVLNVMDGVFSGAQHGVGIYAYNDDGGPYAIDLLRVTVDEFQKTAIALMGAGLMATLTDVETTGAGATGVTAQNGIQVSYGASASLDDCLVADVGYTGSGWTASGILPIEGGTVDIENTTVTNSQTGIYYIETNGSVTACSLTSASIEGSDGITVLEDGARGREGGELTLAAASPLEEEYSPPRGRANTTVTIDNVDLIGASVPGGYGVNVWAYDEALTTTVTGCRLHDWEYGLVCSEAGGVATLSATHCSLVGNDVDYWTNAAAEQDASGNWWGDLDPTDLISETIDYTPWLADGTDQSGDVGFQGDFSELWVDDDSPQVGATGRITESLGLVSGSTIHVAAGEYLEQLHITQNGLELVGAGLEVTTIKSPATLTDYFATSSNNYPVIFVDGATGVEISGVTIDGDGQGNANYRFIGLGFWNADGSLADAAVTGVRETPFNGNQHGVGIYAYNNTGGPYTIALTDVEIDDFQKNAMALSGEGLTVDLDGVVCTGQGSTDLNAQNGIQIGFGAGGTADDCVVQDIHYTPTDWAATGALMWAGSQVDFTGVTCERCEVGVDFYDTDGSFADGVVADPYLDGLYADASGAALRSGGRTQAAAPFGDVAPPRDRSTKTVIVSGSRFVGAGVTDSWGVSTYAEGNVDLTMTDCSVTGWDYGVVCYEDGATSTLTAHGCDIHDNVSYGYSTNAAAVQDATGNWWGAASGPYHPTTNPAGTGNEVSDNVDFDPWRTGNIVCNPDPLLLTSTTSEGDVTVRYLGGGSDAVYGYSIKFSWDGGLVSTSTSDVSEEALLSSLGSTVFHASLSGTDEITVDCALLGDQEGAYGPGDLFTIHFTGLAVGTSPVDVTVLAVRDDENNPLTGFYEDDGEIQVDVSAPSVTDVLITNDTLAHTNDYIKDGDQATVTATVTDDDPAFGLSDITADLSGLGGGGAVNPDSYASDVATWTLTPVTCTPSDGTVTVTVTATDAMGNVTSGSDDITADNTAPTPLAGLDAQPGHQEVSLTWDDASGNDAHYAGVLINYAAWGDYPNYATGAPSYPADETLGTEAFDGTGTSATHTFVDYDRDIYYYGGFVYDEARNYSAADAGGQDRATNYWLGDVRPYTGTPLEPAYDGLVNVLDIDALGTSYYKQAADPGFDDECDVGPTDTGSRLGIPEPDEWVNFEDLIIFAMNHGVVAPEASGPFGLPVEARQGPVALELKAPSAIAPGAEFRVTVRLTDPEAAVQGARFVVAYDADVLECTGSSAGALVSGLESCFFRVMESDGYPDVNVAALGHGAALGTGELVQLRFRCVGEGSAALRLTEMTVRNGANEDLLALPSDVVVDPVGPSAVLPQEVFLGTNAPNPFVGSTQIAFGLPQAQEVRLAIYDVSGRLVRELVSGEQVAGEHPVMWDRRDDRGRPVAGGVYLYRLQTAQRTLTRKLVVSE